MCKRHLKKSVTRRDVLKYTLAGAGIAALGPLGRGAIRPAYGAPQAGLKRCLSLYCYGGYDGLNLVVPTGVQAYYDRRATIAIPEASAIDIGEDGAGYRLHPSLARIGALYNTGNVAIFRKVGYPNANLSHFISQDIHSWGVRDGFAALPIDTSGWIARFADLYAMTPMGAAALGVGRPLATTRITPHPIRRIGLVRWGATTSSTPVTKATLNRGNCEIGSARPSSGRSRGQVPLIRRTSVVARIAMVTPTSAMSRAASNRCLHWTKTATIRPTT